MLMAISKYSESKLLSPDYFLQFFHRFCNQHHGQRRVPPPEPSADLMCVAEAIMPRIILRLLQHLRINSVPSRPAITAAESLEK